MTLNTPTPPLMETIGNGLLERLLITVEHSQANRSPFVHRAISDLVDRHGEAGMSLLGYLVADAVLTCESDDPPPAHFFVEQAKDHLRHNRYGECHSVMAAYQRQLAHHEGRIAYQCDHCDRFRRGRKWRRKKRAPEGYRVFSGILCPNCVPGRGDERTDAEPEPAENPRNSVLDWIRDMDGEGGVR